MFSPKLAICLLVALSLALPGWAATPAVPVPAGSTLTAQALNLQSALQLAGQNHKAYQAALAREQAAQAAWWQSVLAFGPKGNLQAAYVLENKPMVMSLRGQDFEVDTNFYSGSIQVSQPLFAGFKIFNGFQRAGLGYDSAQAETELARSQMVLDVTEAFYGAILTQRLLEITEESLSHMREHLRMVQARYDEGLASNYDLLRTEVQVANMEPSVLKLRNGLRLAHSRLASLIGKPMESLLPLAGSLDMADESWPSLSELVATALAKRLEVKNLERAKQMSEIGYSLAVTSNLPNVSLNAAWTHYDTLDAGFPPAGENLKHYWQLYLGVMWPFWDNFSALPKAAEADAKVREAELGRKTLEDGIRIEVESDYLTYGTAKETLRAQSKAVDLAKNGYSIATQQYAHGLLNNIDVMDAQLALDQAQDNYLQAQYDYLISQVRLHKAIGDKL